MAQRTAARVLTYGFEKDADVRGAQVESLGFDGMRFELRTPTLAGRSGAGPLVSIPALGRMAVHNALAAAAVGVAAGLDLDEIARGLGRGWTAPHRATLVQAGGVSVVDDSYNASPGSVRAALELLAGLPGRHVAVLGEMLELGEAAEDGHRAVGFAAAGSVDLLLVVDGQPGGGAAGIADGAVEAGLAEDRVLRAADRSAALDLLRPRLRPGDVVLVKASRGIELDRLVEDLAHELGGRGGAGRDEPQATGSAVGVRR
jgi:UDP-N-acetylmuramoyl-tripeptide--D-alanyl-D-alanine ligase